MCISLIQKPCTRSAFFRGRDISVVHSTVSLVVTNGCKKVAAVKNKAVNKVKRNG